MRMDSRFHGNDTGALDSRFHGNDNLPAGRQVRVTNSELLEPV